MTSSHTTVQLEDHLDADLLTALAEGFATPAERDLCLAHLSSCEACRAVAFASQDGPGPLFAEAPLPAADFAASPASLSVPPERRESFRPALWSGWWTRLSLGGAALACTVAVAFWTGHRARDTSPRFAGNAPARVSSRAPAAMTSSASEELPTQPDQPAEPNLEAQRSPEPLAASRIQPRDLSSRSLRAGSSARLAVPLPSIATPAPEHAAPRSASPVAGLSNAPAEAPGYAAATSSSAPLSPGMVAGAAAPEPARGMATRSSRSVAPGIAAPAGRPGVSIASQPVVNATAPAPPVLPVPALRGSVIDSAGAPIPDATVLLRRPEDALTRTLTTDAQGNFQAPLLAAGNFTMTITAAGFATLRQRVTVAPAGVTAVTSKLLPGDGPDRVARQPPEVPVINATTNQYIAAAAAAKVGRKAKELPSIRSAPVQPGQGLRGRVTDASGAVVPGAAVSLRHSEDATERTVRTDAQGGFQIALPAGDYAMTVASSGFETLHQPVKVSPGKQATAASTLQAGSVSEAVTVTAADSAVMQQSASTAGSAVVLPPVDRMAGKAAPVVSLGGRTLSLAADGTLQLRAGSAAPRAVVPAWQGRAVSLAVTQDEPRSFRLTTAAGAVWFSADGEHWQPAKE